ncbi:hypothetical protein HK102_007502 [Quaeritorhiza haematococci]|nr:hypothetical protein HK102_007502 [Quaeritorhiza haematococci]
MKFINVLLFALASLAAFDLTVASRSSSQTAMTLTDSFQPRTPAHLERRQPQWVFDLFVAFFKLQNTVQIHETVFGYIACKAAMDVDWNIPANKKAMLPEIDDTYPKQQVWRPYPELANHPSGFYTCDAEYGPSVTTPNGITHFGTFYFQVYEPNKMALIQEIICGVQRDAKGKRAVRDFLKKVVDQLKKIGSVKDDISF